ncbi:hypothetical protein SCP_1500440 [Sparassis crispa]|uniref:Uncharacterized protein n=1 Tax=Sparassis crispa TaxID=139825 RepID=A0A401H3Q7_9APHY|nr:hypothetical protein SCP_1500440 [Sparassis crispa]GBE89042.1 hypothetical protein SCP_1500440 [Sparassis crispa]
MVMARLQKSNRSHQLATVGVVLTCVALLSDHDLISDAFYTSSPNVPDQAFFGPAGRAHEGFVCGQGLQAPVVLGNSNCQSTLTQTLPRPYPAVPCRTPLPQPSPSRSPLGFKLQLS